MGNFGDPDFRRQVVDHSPMDVARSERSPLGIVFAENEPEGGHGQKAQETRDEISASDDRTR